MKALVAAWMLAMAGLAFGQADEVANPNPVVEQRLKSLAEELRCLVCQNQTIADSNAPLALDLRNQIRDQIAKGRSDGEIRDYMVTRYGDFVLYRPPFNAATAALWMGPFLLLLAGAVVFFYLVRRRGSTAAPEAMRPERRAQIESMLAKEPDTPNPPPPATNAGSPRTKARRNAK